MRADVFADGHDEVQAYLLYRECDRPDWQEIPMKFLGNDAWIGSFTIEHEKNYLYSVRGYVSEFSSWCHDLKKKVDAGRDIGVDLRIGSAIVAEAAARCKKQDAAQLKEWSKQLAKPNSAKATLAALAIAMGTELADAMAANLDLEKSATYVRELPVTVERGRALFSSWYELFPRSWGVKPGSTARSEIWSASFPKSRAWALISCTCRRSIR